MSCWPDLSWPSCNPDPSAAPPIYECGDSRTAGQDCCLSVPTTDKGVSNCPPGWASNPTVDQEWCTDSQGIIHDSQYRHKCHRVLSCPNAAQDPATSCKTCKEPKYAYPECSSNQCANPKLLAPECSVCATYDKLAPPECDKCLDVSESLCGIPGIPGVKGGTCVDTRYDEFNCGGCVTQGKGVECAPGEICNDGSCTCGVKFGIVYAEVQGQDSQEFQGNQDSNKFLIKLHWTSPEQFGVTLRVFGDWDGPKDIMILKGNTSENPPGVFETTFALDKPRSSPVEYTFELRRESVVSSKKLKVDFPDYANSNLNCGSPENACVPDRKCVEGECIIPCPQGKSGCVNPQNDENVCVDFQSDVLNCGSCGRACVSPGPPTCVLGDCQCPEKDLYCSCRYEGERKPDEQCVFGKIDNAIYNSSLNEITITYSLSMPVLPYFVASVLCLNIDYTRQEKSTFDVRQGLKQQVTLQCVDESGLGWVPDACFLIVSNLSSKEKYISTGCPRPGFGACGSKFEVALEPLTDIRYGFDFRFYRQLAVEKCTDLSSSLDNCGECDNFCPVNQVCAGSECVDGCRGSNPAYPEYIDVDGVPKCVFAVVRKAQLTSAAPFIKVSLVFDADVPEGLQYYFQLLGGATSVNSQLFTAGTAVTRKTQEVEFDGNLDITGTIFVLIKVPRPNQPAYMDYRSELTEVQISGE